MCVFIQGRDFNVSLRHNKIEAGEDNYDNEIRGMMKNINPLKPKLV
jgi:hypothetical protein